MKFICLKSILLISLALVLCSGTIAKASEKRIHARIDILGPKNFKLTPDKNCMYPPWEPQAKYRCIVKMPTLKDNNWQKVTFSFIPEKSDSILLRLSGSVRVSNGKKVPIWFCFDGISAEGTTIVNGDFMELDSKGKPVGWAGSGTILKSEKNYFSGAQSIKVSETNYIEQRIPVEKGRKVTISTMVRLADADKIAVKVYPRKITFKTPIANAIIIYPSKMQEGISIAKEISEAVKLRTGKELKTLSDTEATDSKTWEIKNEYLELPLIILGNAENNRAMFALAANFLVMSNKRWPGEDKFCNRSILEPFRRDVNNILLEASSAIGLKAAAGAFSERIKSCEDSKLELKYFRKLGAAKGEWKVKRFKSGKIDFSTNLEGIKKQLIEKYGEKVKIGDGGLFWFDAWKWLAGYDENAAKYSAAILLMVYERRKPYLNMGHYHYDEVVKALRLCFSSGALDEKEINLFESALGMTATDPHDYNADHIIKFKGNTLNSYCNRHTISTVANFLCLTDYVLTHCKLSPAAKDLVKEYHEAYLSGADEITDSFRSDNVTSEISDCVIMQINLMAMIGKMSWFWDGYLKRACEYWLATNNNLGYYIGQGPYIGSKKMTCKALGKSAFASAAFFYQDPRYQWLYKHLKGQDYCRTAKVNPVYNCGMAEKFPEEYLGAFAVPVDQRLYRVHQRSDFPRQPSINMYKDESRPASELYDQAWIRDGFSPNDAFLALSGSEKYDIFALQQLNLIVQYTDLGKILLFTHTQFSDAWRKNMVSVSNGEEALTYPYCRKKALLNSPGARIATISSVAEQYGGSDWSRNIIHRKGHFFIVVDQIKALKDDEYLINCRWRSPHPGVLNNGICDIDAGDGVKLTIIPAEDLRQDSIIDKPDTYFKPYYLSQHKHKNLKKDESVTFRNVFYASSPARPDKCEVKGLDKNSLMVHGTGKDWDETVLAGIEKTPENLPLKIVADIYYVDEKEIVAANCREIVINGKSVFSSEKPENIVLDATKFALGKILKECFSRTPAIKYTSYKDSKDLADKSSGNNAFTEKWSFNKFSRPNLALPVKAISSSKTWKGYKNRPLKHLLDKKNKLCVDHYYRGPYRKGNEGESDIILDLGEKRKVKDISLWGGHVKLKLGFNNYNKLDDVKFKVFTKNTEKDPWKTIDSHVKFENYSFPNAGYTWAGRVSRYLLNLNCETRFIKLVMTTQKEHLFFQKLKVYGPEKAPGLNLDLKALKLGAKKSNLLVKTSNSEIVALTPEGDKSWSRQFKNCVITAWTAADLNADERDEIIVATTDNTFTVLNAETGAIRREIDLKEVYKKEKPDSWYRWHIPYTFQELAVIPDQTEKSSGATRKDSDIIACWHPGVSRISHDDKVTSKSEFPYYWLVKNVCPGTEVMGQPSAAYMGATGFFVKDKEQQPLFWLSRGDFKYAPPMYEAKSYSSIIPVANSATKGFLMVNYGTIWWIPAETPRKGWMKHVRAPISDAILLKGATGNSELAIGARDGFVKVYDVESGKILRKFYAGAAVVRITAGKDQSLAVITKDGIALFDENSKRIAFTPGKFSSAIKTGNVICVADDNNGSIQAFESQSSEP